MKASSILLAAHGAGEGSDVNERLGSLAASMSARYYGSSVLAVFNLGTPTFAEAASGRASLVVPVMTSDAYFVRGRLVPAMRGSVVTPPIGVDPALRADVVRRAMQAVGSAVGGGRGVCVVVGHGTRRAANSGATTAALRDALDAEFKRSAPGWRAADAYLDQEPLLEDVASSVTDDIVAVPWLIGGGGHDLDDVGERIGLGSSPRRGAWLQAGGRRVFVLASLLESGLVATAAVRMVETAHRRLPLRLVTRGSRLALWQAREAQRVLSAAGVSSTICVVESEGDRDLTSPIESFGKTGIFTDALADELARGAADVAVHSLKDLPLATEESLLHLPAVLARDAAGEALVARDGRRLADLPAGAVVGTSSARRARQVLCLRPDLRVAPIRGAVEERVRQVLEGRFDATVLAVAGLRRLGMLEVITERFSPEQLTPEPGQGVIALQTRADDWFTQSLVGRVDHGPTRAAVTAERAFAQMVQDSGVGSPCAVAHVDGSSVRLLSRLAGPGGITPLRSAVGSDAETVAADAVERALVESAEGAGV